MLISNRKTWRWMYNRGSRQYSRVEGLELTSSHESNKIKTNCWTIINKKVLNIWKKCILQPKTKKKKDSGRGCFFNIIKSYTCQVGSPQTWKLLYCRGSLTGVRVLSPTLGSKAWGLATEREAHKHLALKANEACVQEFHRTGEISDSTLGGITYFMCTGTQSKAVTP